jgi:hypothetical protein
MDDKDTDKQERRERIKESRYKRKFERCTWGEREKERGVRKQVLDGRKGKEVQNVL